jgi:hypothetical protein
VPTAAENLVALALREIRELAALGVSRREIARRTGGAVKPSTVYGVIMGQHGLSGRVAERVVAAQITKRWVTIALPDGSRIRGQPATKPEASRLSQFAIADRKARRNDWSALDDPDFRRPVTVITQDGRRMRVRLPTDREFIREMAEREEDIVNYSESESP